MIYYNSLQALGDNLISLSMLNQIEGQINVFGTNNTKKIIELLNLENKFHLEILFDDVPAFYDIRAKGLLRALYDYWNYIKVLNRHDRDVIILEKQDFRSFILKLIVSVPIYTPCRYNKNAYSNRKQVIENLYGSSINLNHYVLLIKNPKTIVINPLSRVVEKNICNNHLAFIISELNKCKYEIYLIDIEMKYQNFKTDVQYYLTDTTLEDVKVLLKNCDLYIGADSFLIHLAYYLQKNYFMIFYRDNDDFLPPNITQDFYIKAHESDDFHSELKQKFYNIGLLS